MAEEPRYTRAEWVEQEMRRVCAEDGHKPYHWYMEVPSQIPVSGVCECGQVTWTPMKLTADD